MVYPLTDRNRSWYIVSTLKGLEAYLYPGSYVKGQGQNWTLTIFLHWQPCEHFTPFILRSILTKHGIQVVDDYYFSESQVGLSVQIGLLTVFSHWQPCKLSTLKKLLLILTIFSIILKRGVRSLLNKVI